MGGHPDQAPENPGHVCTEQTPVGVNLVDDDVFEVPEEIAPAIVIGEHGQVHHVGIGNENRWGGFPQSGAFIRGGVAIIDGREQLEVLVIFAGEGIDLGERSLLILGQCFERE